MTEIISNLIIFNNFPQIIKQNIKCFYVSELNFGYCVTNDNKVYGLGENIYERLGYNEINDKRCIEIEELFGQNIEIFFEGNEIMFAKNDRNQIFHWGWTGTGDLKNKNKIYFKPQKFDLFDGKSIIQISCGTGHCLALSSDGLVYGWGANSCGQIGCGIEINFITTPIEINLKTKIKFIYCWSDISFAVTVEQNGYYWGKIASGEVVIFKPRLIPVKNVSKICNYNTYSDDIVLLNKTGNLIIFNTVNNEIIEIQSNVTFLDFYRELRKDNCCYLQSEDCVYQLEYRRGTHNLIKTDFKNFFFLCSQKIGFYNNTIEIKNGNPITKEIQLNGNNETLLTLKDINIFDRKCKNIVNEHDVKFTTLELQKQTKRQFYSLEPNATNMANTFSKLELEPTRIITTPSVPNVSKLLETKVTPLFMGENISKGKYETIFDEIRRIGSGAFSEVFEVIHKSTDFLFAIKRVELKSDLSEEINSKDLNEIKIMSKLDSVFIVQYIDSWIEEKVIYNKTKRFLFIQMEFCSKNLRDFIDLFNQITIERLQTFNYFISFKIFKELIECVNYLHSINIIHRDLKPENILMSGGINGRLLKLCDFGLSKVHEISVHTRMIGTLQYMAPEVINSNNYNTKSDIYSLALIGTEIFLFEYNIKIIRNHKTIGDFNNYLSKYLNTILAKNFNHLLEMLSKCLLPKDYHSRPDCKQLLETINKFSLDIVIGNEYTLKAIEDFKELFVALPQKDPEHTKYFCQRFESFYMEVEKGLFLRDFVKSKQVMTTQNKSNEEDNSPLKIFNIRKQKLKSIYELKSEELRRWLRPINDYEVAVIPIVGPSRKGKSFILNYMCRYLANSRKSDWLGRKITPLKGFHWKSETISQTDGIWISKPYILEKSNGKKIAVLLLDTKGIFDQHTNKRDWSTIVGLSLLISSCLIFNIPETLQEDALIFLESFLEYGMRASRALPNLSEAKPFQNMLFLIRDWGVPIKHKYGLSGGKEYLNDKLQIEENQEELAQNSRRLLKQCFSEVDCFLMPKLGERSDEPGFDGRVGQLSQDFSRKLKELIVHILNPDEIKPKKLSDKPITGAEVCQLMESFVNVFNSSEFDKPSPKDLLNAYSRFSQQFNLRRNKILHLSMLGSIVQSQPFLARNALVESCGKINKEISNIFHEELTTNDDNKWQFIREMESSFEDNFSEVYAQNEIRRKEYITKAIEECKQLYIELTQKDSEQTKSLNLLAFDEYLKECEKTVCERFESYYMGEEKYLFLKDLIDLKELMNTRKESLRQIQIKHLDKTEGKNAELVEINLQLYSAEIQNLLDTNIFIDSQMFKVFEEKIRADTIETFKENFKIENTRTNQFFLLDLEKNIKERKKQFKKLNEKKCQEIIENTEELLRKSVTEYEKNIIQWVDVCDTTQDLLKRHNMAKNDSTEHFVNKCLYREESFLKPFLNRLDNEMIKIYNHFESVVNSKNSIYENAFHLSLDNYQNQMKIVLEMRKLPDENQLEKSNKTWMKEAKSLFVKQFMTTNPSKNLYYRYQNELNNKMEKIFHNFVEEVKDREKQMETKIYSISQKMLTKFSTKMKNFIQYVRNREELNYKLQEVKEELLNDFVEKLEFTNESLLESNKNDLNKLVDIEIDKIKLHLESRKEELENSFQTGVFQYSDKYVQKMEEFSKTQEFYNEIILSTFHQNLKIDLIRSFKNEFKSILNISVEEYESNLEKSIENEFNVFVQKRLNKISKINDCINELVVIYLDKMETELNRAQNQTHLEIQHLSNKEHLFTEFLKQNQLVPQSFLTEYKCKLEDQIDKNYDQLLAELFQREEDFKNTFD